MEQSHTPNTDANPRISPYTAHVYKSLSEIGALGDNWDGEGATVPNGYVRETMLSVLSLAEGEDSVFPALTPTGEGGLFAQWHAGPGNMIVIEVDPDGAAEVNVWQQGVEGSQQVLGGSLNDSGSQEKLREHLAAMTDRVNAANPNWRNLFPR